MIHVVYMGHLSESPVYNFLSIFVPFLKMAVIDASFQIEGSLLCLSEVSNMTLRGSLTSIESSLSNLGCILSKPRDFPGFSAASFISIMFSMDSSCLLMPLTSGCCTFRSDPIGSYMYTLLKNLDISSAFSLSVEATTFPANHSRLGILSLIRVRDLR